MEGEPHIEEVHHFTALWAGRLIADQAARLGHTIECRKDVAEIKPHTAGE